MMTISKTYAPRGTSTSNGGEVSLWRSAPHRAQEHLMWDVVMLALGLGFFAAAISYAYACERL
jgi:hypothetical protein